MNGRDAKRPGITNFLTKKQFTRPMYSDEEGTRAVKLARRVVEAVVRGDSIGGNLDITHLYSSLVLAIGSRNSNLPK